MGTDIHGCWELHAPDGNWYAWRGINESRTYEWFSIMSDVRWSATFPGAPCGSKWNPSLGASSYWMRSCCDEEGKLRERWMHGHTVATYDDVERANKLLRGIIKARRKMIDHEDLPLPDDPVDALWLGPGLEALPMRVPLWVVLGFEAIPGSKDPGFRSKLRFMCGYDS